MLKEMLEENLLLSLKAYRNHRPIDVTELRAAINAGKGVLLSLAPAPIQSETVLLQELSRLSELSDVDCNSLLKKKELSAWRRIVDEHLSVLSKGKEKDFLLSRAAFLSFVDYATLLCSAQNVDVKQVFDHDFLFALFSLLSTVLDYAGKKSFRC